MSYHIEPTAADILRMNPWRRNDSRLQAEASRDRQTAAREHEHEERERRRDDRELREVHGEEYPGQYSNGWD